jgi:hypothetical protein
MRGLCYYDKGDYQKALVDLDRSCVLDPSSPLSRRALAWVLSACPDKKIRNGREALIHSNNLHTLVGRYLPHESLQAMAAAYAELGRFSDAVGLQYMAIAVLQQTQLIPLVKRAEARLKAYQAHKPLRFDSYYEWN